MLTNTNMKHSTRNLIKTSNKGSVNNILAIWFAAGLGRVQASTSTSTSTSVSEFTSTSSRVLGLRVRVQVQVIWYE